MSVSDSLRSDSLRKQANKLKAKGDTLLTERAKLWDEGVKLWADRDKLWADRDKLWADRDKLLTEADKLWAEADKLKAKGNDGRGRYRKPPTEIERLEHETTESRIDVQRTKTAYVTAQHRVTVANNKLYAYNLKQQKCSCPPVCDSCGKEK